MLHNDIPTRAQVERLAQVEDGLRVSIYLESGVQPQQGEMARIALKDQTREAEEKLAALGASNREITAIREHLEDIENDAAFWLKQSRSLAVFASENSATVFRLPNRLTPSTTVGPRYSVKQLLRTLSFPQAAYVLALSMNDVHLVAITPDNEPRKVDAPELPRDFDHAVREHVHTGSTVAGKMQNQEGEKTRLRQFARIVDRGVRQALGSTQLPIILAAAEPLQSIFREVSTLPNLVSQAIVGNAESFTDLQLADTARGLLDEIYADELKHIGSEQAQRANSGRSATDLSDIARAAVMGAIQTLVFDMDATAPGSIDPATGELVLAADGADTTADALEDLVRLALASDSRIIAVREGEVPGGGDVAALLRYAV